MVKDLFFDRCEGISIQLSDQARLAQKIVVRRAPPVVHTRVRESASRHMVPVLFVFFIGS